MKKAPELTAERLREVLHYCPETGLFTWIVAVGRRVRAGDRAGTADNQGYAVITFAGRRYLAHRLAWLYTFASWPKGEIDHSNRDRGDNRLKNLREATRSENQQNTLTPSRNTSGHKGVVWHGRARKWQACLMVNQRQVYLGTFASPESAIAARKAAEAKYHPFAPKEAAHA